MKPLTPTTPHVIILVGIPGSGKTTFAEHFAKTFHAPYINTPGIEATVGINKAAALKVTELLFDELLKTQRSLVYEGPTENSAERLALSKYVAKAGYKSLIVWVQTDPQEAKRRATKRSKVGALSPSEFDAAYAQFMPPIGNEKPAVISGKHTYATQLKVVLKHIAGTRPATSITSEPRTQTGRNITVR